MKYLNRYFTRQRRSFSERNFQGALLLEKETLDKTFSATAVALAERNFQGALLLEKETLK